MTRHKMTIEESGNELMEHGICVMANGERIPFGEWHKKFMQEGGIMAQTEPNSRCPWCGKHHRPKKGEHSGLRGSGPNACKCENPRYCECHADGEDNVYCPDCGRAYGIREW